MHGLRRRKIAWRITFLFVVILVDQLIKFCATRDLLPTAGGFLDFTCNENIAWGIPLKGLLFLFLWIISILVLIWLTKRHCWNFFLLMILAGAFSNMIDRIFYGCVVDYIKIGIFPVFNLADTSITIGLLLFLVTGQIKNKKAT